MIVAALSKNHSLNALKGVGPATVRKLQALGFKKIQDLLFHLPYRYQDRTQITPLGALLLNSHVLVEATIVGSSIVFGRRRSLLVVIEDSTGKAALRFFHFNQAQKNNLSPGSVIRCFGEVRRGSSGLELYHPEYMLVTGDKSPDLDQTLTPIYPSIDGFSQKSLRKLVEQALFYTEKFPLDDYLANCNLDNSLGQQSPPLSACLQLLHKPPTQHDFAKLSKGEHIAQKRLSFEELLAQRFGLLHHRLSNKLCAAVSLNNAKDCHERFQSLLNFSLTKAQKGAIRDIAKDLAKTKPMMRLIQGDVGCGKTLVSAFASHQIVTAGMQVAVMAPTEILAEQLFQVYSQLFSQLNFETLLLTGKMAASQKKAALRKIKQQDALIVVGTHALFQTNVEFKALALLIIDEQHRFGVHQRFSLREKANPQLGLPHQLVMTATPIPRTLAMSAYADLDKSTIDELPPGRTPIKTVVINNTRREKIIERVKHACEDGAQVYWVCTLIEDSEQLQAQAAEVSAEQLRIELKNTNIGLLHGRMKANEKQSIMAQFKSGAIQLLVATTVIEVGVDVPNATVMVIENAERLGLAQLHQLRGRVGRGAKESYCVLAYQEPLSKIGQQRLHALRESNDGFFIAEKDLELRGPGELLGTQQTGLARMRVADLQRDAELLPAVEQVSNFIQENNPELIELLIKRWLPLDGEYAKA